MVSGSEIHGAIFGVLFLVQLIGTALITWWVEVLIGLMPPRMLKRIFPPALSGLTILLIGVSLISSAFNNWVRSTSPLPLPHSSTPEWAHYPKSS
jgi:xanthine/uracil permease